MNAFEDLVSQKQAWVEGRRRDGADGVFRATALALPMPPSLHDALLVPRAARAVVPHINRLQMLANGATLEDIAQRVQALTHDGASAFVVSTWVDEDGTGFEDILTAAQNTHVPIICRDVIIDPLQLTLARAHGAASVVLCAHLLDRRVLRGLRRAARDLSLQTILDVSSVRHVDGPTDAGKGHDAADAQIYGADLLCCSSRDATRFRARLADVAPEHAITIVPVDEETSTDLHNLHHDEHSAFVIDANNADFEAVRARMRAAAGELAALA